MRRYCRRLARCALSEHDSAGDAQRKEIWMLIQVTVLALLIWYTRLNAENFPRADVLGSILGVITLVIAVVYPIVTRTLPQAFMGSVLVALSVGAILIDSRAAAALGPIRPWTGVILLLDLCLALDVPVAYQRAVLACTSAWIVTFGIEGALRLGLYDVELLLDGAPPTCDCANPPCAGGVFTLSAILATFAIVLGDYFATRSFAEGLRGEQARVVASIMIAERVATSLTGFDLDAARAVLDEAGDGLPSGLDATLRQLLRNLASYRPYLPHACFTHGDDAAEDQDCPSPRRSLQSTSLGTSGWQTPTEGSQAGAAAVEDFPVSDATLRLPSSAAPPELAARAASKGSIRSASEDERACSPCELPRVSLGPRERHLPLLRRVALLTCNSRGLLAAPQLSPETAAAWLAEQVEQFTAVVHDQGGVADLLSGDHLSASFGAVRAQGSRAALAARAAAALTADSASAGALGVLRRTAAVCGGGALCGDFGSSACLRFMVIGAASAFLPAAERCAAAWGVPVLLDTAVHEDVEQFWSCRLRRVVRFPKVSPRPVGLWELQQERLSCVGQEEWMYQLRNADANPWEPYNSALLSLSAREPHGALALIEQALKGIGGGEVAAGLLALRELAQQEEGPPHVRDLSAAAFAGDPAPLAPRPPGAGC